MALLRLQDTYRLDVKEIASGKIMNASIAQPLTGNHLKYEFIYFLMVKENLSFLPTLFPQRYSECEVTLRPSKNTAFTR